MKFCRRVFRELASGRLNWRPADVDRQKNTHFVFAYKLAANELVAVCDDQNDKENRAKLPEFWKDIQEPERFPTKLAHPVQRALLLAAKTKGDINE